MSDETVRSDALRRYDILDTPPEPDFDRITRIASIALRRPICTLALADGDRFWFKSRQGVDLDEIPRRMAFCECTVANDGVTVVEDAARDPRFADTPLVDRAPYIRFYAGAPLVTPQGVRVGSLCVLDVVPNSGFTEQDRGILADLASTAVDLLEARARQIELARCTREIAYLARHDPLTGLPNRRHLAELHRDADRPGRGLALLYLDLDGFKAVNDERGHACGDLLLRQVADRIRSCLPPGASVARVGGDEFAILLPGPPETVRTRAAALAQRLIRLMDLRHDDAASGASVGCSIGIAAAEASGTGLDVMLGLADAALYRAKQEGRGRFILADPHRPLEPLALCG